MTARSPSIDSASLPRRLSLPYLIVYGLLFIGPLAPASIFGVLDAKSNGAVALVYVVATLVMACTAWSYAQMSRHVPHAGSVFAYAREGLGPAAGFMAGWMAMLDYLLIPALAFLFSGVALHSLMPAVPSWLFTVTAFVAANLLNFLGARTAARAGSVMLGIEVVVLVLFLVGAVVVLTQHGAQRAWFTPLAGMGEGLTASSLVGAVSIAVLSFLGFDAIAAFAEETSGDSHQVGRAIGVCLVVAGLVFVIQTYLAGLLSMSTPAQLVAQPSAQDTEFFDLTRVSLGAWFGTVMAVTKSIGPAFAAMTGQAAAARLLFGMARDGSLPVSLAGVDTRRGIPAMALATTGFLTIAVAVWAARRHDGLSLLSSIVNVGALSAFMLLHIAVFGYFVIRRRASSNLAHWMVPAIGVVSTGWVIVGAGGTAQLIAGAWLGVGVTWFCTGRYHRSA